MAALRNLGAEKSRRFRASFIGRCLPAITLHTPQLLAAGGRTSGLTDNYLPVELAASLPANRLVNVRVTGIQAEGSLLAEINAERTAPHASIHCEPQYA